MRKIHRKEENKPYSSVKVEANIDMFCGEVAVRDKQSDHILWQLRVLEMVVPRDVSADHVLVFLGDSKLGHSESCSKL